MRSMARHLVARGLVMRGLMVRGLVMWGRLMRGRLIRGVGLAIVISQLTGCALSDLKNTNRRLKEANDRLVVDNNRLEQELALRERRRADSEPDRPTPRELPTLPYDPLPQDGAGQLRDLGLETGTTAEGTRVRLEDAVFFDLGKANLSTPGRKILDRVAIILGREYAGRMIRIEGHTDDLPIKKLRHRYPSNWELSTDRACAVVRYLESRGMNPSQVYPAGYSFHRPRSPGKSERDRRLNRRVEILILRDPLL